MLLFAKHSNAVVAEGEFFWSSLERVADAAIHLRPSDGKRNTYVAIEEEIERIAFHVTDEVDQAREYDGGCYFGIRLISREQRVDRIKGNGRSAWHRAIYVINQALD